MALHKSRPKKPPVPGPTSQQLCGITSTQPYACHFMFITEWGCSAIAAHGRCRTRPHTYLATDAAWAAGCFSPHRATAPSLFARS